jgi:valyl-tRNA synthetase
MGWPDDTPELRRYYPTSVLVTGYDILFFWVARMAMFGLHLTDVVPFRDIYLHTLVRDAEGQKMSKSKGNVVDPLEVMDRFGTDAFRFTLASLAVPGVRDIRISDERIEGSRNFANKLWNASRLVLTNLDGYDGRRSRSGAPALAERWIESRLATAARAVRDHLRRYRFNDAASVLYQFVWHDFCDWYLEIAKLSLYRPESPAERARAQRTLVTVLETTLRLLHPFMPFVTEEIWQRLPDREARGESIMLAPFPRSRRAPGAAAAERDMATVMGLVTAVRNVRGEMRVSPGVTLQVTVRPTEVHEPLVAGSRRVIEALARAEITLDRDAARPAGSAIALVDGSEVFVALAGLVDVAAERQRLTKEIRRVDEAIAFLETKLARPEFVEKAPAEVVQRERERLVSEQGVRAKLTASLGWLGDAGAG